MKMFKHIIVASAAVMTLAGTASATTYSAPKSSPEISADKMAAPPWWYPIWGTWVGGTNIKICKDLSVIADASENGPTVVHLNNIDGTDLDFTLKLSDSKSVGVWQSLIAACDHSDDNEAANWKHRWYKIDLEKSTTTGVPILHLSGAGDQSLTIIKSVTVPTGHSIPSH